MIIFSCQWGDLLQKDSFVPLKSYSNYFLFFENKAKRLNRTLQICLVIGILANVVLAILLQVGAVQRPKPNIAAHETPAPKPPHFLEPQIDSDDQSHSRVSMRVSSPGLTEPNR